MFVRRTPKKTNLFPIPPTPLANHKVQLQPNAFGKTKLCVERLGLQPRGIAARGIERAVTAFYESA
jgi:hypothetical protein